MLLELLVIGVDVDPPDVDCAATVIAGNSNAAILATRTLIFDFIYPS
jgi:hypothetical protein